MKYTINNINIIDKNDKYKHILDHNFLKQSDKQKLIFITNNTNIYYKDQINTKFLKIKFFMLNNDLSLRKIDKKILDQYIYKLLSKLIYKYGYLLK
jgi:hypothetical protein